MTYMGQQPSGSIRVAKFVLQESGTYNPMYSRPWTTHVTQQTLTDVINRVEQTQATNVTGATLAGVAGNMVMPTAVAGNEILIPQGWTDRRIRFVLEVHETTATGLMSIYYFQGYTNCLGVLQNWGKVSIDPNMEFVINSFIRVNRSNVMTPTGMVSRDVVTATASILNGQIYYDDNSHCLMSMRPQDVFTGIEGNYLSMTANYTGGGGLTDNRANIFGEVVCSNRNNNIPANYIAKVVDMYQVGLQLNDFGQSTSEIYSRAKDHGAELRVSENSFIRTLSHMRGVPQAVSFTYGVLERIDPNIKAVTNFLQVGQAQRGQLMQAGQMQVWNSADRETVAATILLNAVPALMMDLMLTSITFRSTNHDVSGRMSTTIIGGMGLANIDLTNYYKAFIRRFESEVMPDITYNNQEIYMADISVDLYGESRIAISLGSGPMVPFGAPSFCDSLLAPVVTNDRSLFTNTTGDFEALLNGVMEINASKAPTINTAI